jgi:tetratricopeptide (TPR) repeat protein
METEKVAYESLRILKHYTDGSFGILHYFSTAWSNTAALQPMLEVVSKETEAWILEHCGSLRESSLWSVIQHHLLVQLLNAIQTNSKFGPEHVCTAIVRNKIANCHMRLKEFAEAMSHFNWLRGMLVTEKLGTDALWTLGPEVLSNLKYDGQFRVSESKNFSEIALGLAKFIYDRALKHFPLNDDGLYKHVEAYKRVLCDRRDYTAVRDMYESLWQDRPHAWESKCLSRIGLVLAEDCFVRGLMMEAIQRASEVLSRNTTFFGSTDRETIAASNLMSEFYTGRGQYEKSLQIHTRMVQLLEENGASGQKYTEQVNLKGRALQRLGQWKDAERVYNRLWNHLAKDIPIAYFARKSENLRVWEERARETKAPPPKSWHHEKHWEKSLGSM